MKRKKNTALTAALAQGLESPPSPLRPRIFINYRRQDTEATAAHLYDSLARKFGAKRVFRDKVTIQPGQDFPTAIDDAIRRSCVLIVLIGRQWLTMSDGTGRRRLDDPRDHLRLEIESALRRGIKIVPLLVDGATMPKRELLPRAIAALAKKQAYVLPWDQGVAKIRGLIAREDREYVKRETARRSRAARVDLLTGNALTTVRSNSLQDSIRVVLAAMETALHHGGQKVHFDPADLAKSLKRHRVMFFPDLIHVIDSVGVKVRNVDARYSARSFPLSDIREIPAQLRKGKHPVLVGLNVYHSWFEPPASESGLVEVRRADQYYFGVNAAVVGVDAKKRLRVLTPWPEWGGNGIATMTLESARVFIDPKEMRYVEPAIMAVPVEVPASRRSHRRGKVHS